MILYLYITYSMAYPYLLDTLISDSLSVEFNKESENFTMKNHESKNRSELISTAETRFKNETVGKANRKCSR